MRLVSEAERQLLQYTSPGEDKVNYWPKFWDVKWNKHILKTAHHQNHLETDKALHFNNQQ